MTPKDLAAPLSPALRICSCPPVGPPAFERVLEPGEFLEKSRWSDPHGRPGNVSATGIFAVNRLNEGCREIAITA
jgi:hypothetical protein